MSETHERGRFRFRLRTLFVAVAVVSVLLGWLEWNRHIVHERQATLRLLGNQSMVLHLAESNAAPDYSGLTDAVVKSAIRSGVITANAEPFPATEGNSLPWLRRELGDRPYYMIGTCDPELIRRIRKWFPEAVCVLDRKNQN